MRDEELIAAIETSLFFVPNVPGRIELLDLPGVTGWVTPVKAALANWVGLSAFSEPEAPKVISLVTAAYRQCQSHFSWVIGPSCSPPNLECLLTSAGFFKIGEYAGMATENLEGPFRINPVFDVRETNSAAMTEAAVMMAHAYEDIPVDLALSVAAAFGGDTADSESKSYLAYDKRHSMAVGYSYMLLLRNSPIAVLRHAATMPEYRHQGVYTNMVAHRLADARRCGKHVVLIHARRDMTAQILSQLGFRELCNLELYCLSAVDSESVLK